MRRSVADESISGVDIRSFGDAISNKDQSVSGGSRSSKISPDPILGRVSSNRRSHIQQDHQANPHVLQHC